MQMDDVINDFFMGFHSTYKYYSSRLVVKSSNEGHAAWLKPKLEADHIAWH